MRARRTDVKNGDVSSYFQGLEMRPKRDISFFIFYLAACDNVADRTNAAKGSREAGQMRLRMRAARQVARAQGDETARGGTTKARLPAQSPS
jgi:hypothetical protein